MRHKQNRAVLHLIVCKNNRSFHRPRRYTSEHHVNVWILGETEITYSSGSESLLSASWVFVELHTRRWVNVNIWLIHCDGPFHRWFFLCSFPLFQTSEFGTYHCSDTNMYSYSIESWHHIKEHSYRSRCSSGMLVSILRAVELEVSASNLYTLVRTGNVDQSECKNVRWGIILNRTHALLVMRWLQVIDMLEEANRLSIFSLALADGILYLLWVKCFEYTSPKLSPLPWRFADRSVIVVFLDLNFSLAWCVCAIEDMSSYGNLLYNRIRTLQQ